MSPRLRAKADTNQKALVAYARALGIRIKHLHQLGGGISDLLAYYPPADRIGIIEVKTETGKMTPGEKEFAKIFPVHIWRNERHVRMWRDGELEPWREADG